MKRWLLIFALATPLAAQVSNPSVVPVSSAPSVCNALPLYIIAPGNSGAGTLYGNSGSGTSCAILATPGGYTLPSQYATWRCVDGLAGSSALATSGWPAVPTCYNSSGATLTITAIRCVVDGGSSTTIAITDGSGNNLINASTFTCSTSWASATQSSTTTIASGGYIKWTATPDGTAKAVTIQVSGTY